MLAPSLEHISFLPQKLEVGNTRYLDLDERENDCLVPGPLSVVPNPL